MQPSNDFQLTSPAFQDGEAIPDVYTCKGEDISPPLAISGVPEGTVSLALVMHDPDAPGGDFLHWTVWNIEANLTALDEGVLPEGAVQGATDFGRTGYGGPCPPAGTHRYVFDLYALDDMISPSVGASQVEVKGQISQHQLAQTSLTGMASA